MFRLSEEEIRKKFIKLNNYENLLYPNLKERNARIRSENKELKAENKKLSKENEQNKKAMDKILLELEELKEMQYWKKRKQRKNNKVTLPAKDSKKWEKPEKPENKKERSAESYRKDIPKEKDITWELRHTLDQCPDCWSDDITDKQEHISYLENLNWLHQALKKLKSVTKKTIESGKCLNCKKRKVASKLPKHTVEIWRDIKWLIVYNHVLLWLSHNETIQTLKSQYDIKVSKWQITNSLDEQADLLRPKYQEIYNSLQEEVWVHYDETTWKLQWANVSWKNWNDWEWNYSWVKVWVESNNVIYWFWKSRWKGVAEKLRWNIEIKTNGKNKDTEEIIEIKNQIKDQVWISDDYWAYSNMFVNHQLCWAHPFRKIRDLAQSWVLDSSISKHCIKTYGNFAKLYKKVQKARDKFNKWNCNCNCNCNWSWNWNCNLKCNWNLDYWWYKTYEDKEKDIIKLKLEFDKFCIPHKKDPWKLKTIKETLKDRRDKYFTCLHIKGIPLDNNKAERVIRKIVIKRKKSLWCKSQKWANTLSILYSVVFSIYNLHPPENFLEEYEKALNLDSK